MSSRSLSDQAILLRQRPSGEKFISQSYITFENGVLHSLSRIPRKNATAYRPDLYDEGNLALESSNNGSAYFFKEFELETKRAGLAHSYETLTAAASLSQLFLSNPIHEENGNSHYELAKRCLNALDRNINPDAVFIKCLYL